MRVAYFDLIGGISGDMTLGALVDAGARLDELRAGLASLALPGWRLDAKRELRGAVAATRVAVVLDAGVPMPERHLADVLAIIDRGAFPARVKERALAVFGRLADAEAHVHGTTPQAVHFHEVGAVDAIVDVVGAALGLELLGIDRVESSPLPLARGATDSMHGRIPLPGPAVLALAATAHAPIVGRPGERELVTPTGAAIVTALAAAFGDFPSMNVDAVGYGAGGRADEPGRPPNVLRVVVGEEAGTDTTPGEVCVVEANIDDQSPAVTGVLFEALQRAGALEVFLTPVLMKKGRAAAIVGAIVPPERASLVEDALLRESSTLGVRRRRETRTVLRREVVTVETAFGPVRVKLAHRPGGVTASPEHDDCAAAARAHAAPLPRVYRAAQEAAWALPALKKSPPASP